MKSVTLDTLKRGDSFIYDGDKLSLGLPNSNRYNGYNCWIRDKGYAIVLAGDTMVETED